MIAETTLPSMSLDKDRADRIRRISERRRKIDELWRQELRDAIAAGASLRAVAEAAGVSHMAVKFIAHGRPAK